MMLSDPVPGTPESQVAQPVLARSLQGCDMGASTRLRYPDAHSQAGYLVGAALLSAPRTIALRPSKLCKFPRAFQSQGLPPGQGRKRARDPLPICPSPISLREEGSFGPPK